MEEKFKNLLLKDIERRVKSNFNNDYEGNIDEINRYFFKLYGKKERILLDVLITYANSLNVDNVKFLASIIDIFDINVITDFILNNLIKTNEVRENMWRELITKSSSKPLLFKFLNQTRTNPIKFKILLNLMVKSNPLTFYQDVKEIIVKIFKDFIEEYEFYYILDVLDLEKNLKKLPNFFIEEIKKFIDSLKFEEQVKLKQIYRNIPNYLFTKIKESDYIIVGRPDDTSGVIMVKNLDNLYGYIDKNEELIIPIVFDEISSVNKRGLIIGIVNKKRGKMDPGIYKMDKSGKVVEILPS